MAIQNFNLNFIILAIGFAALAIISFIVQMKTNEIFNENNDVSNHLNNNNQKQITKNLSLEKMASLKFWSKLQLRVFPVSNQVAFWLIIPIFSAFSGQILAHNNQSDFITQETVAKWFLKMNSPIIFLSLMMLLFICLNNFKNLWLGIHTFKKLLERPEEMQYKRLLLVYIFIVGFLIFFFNEINIFRVIASIIVLFIQAFYLIGIIMIDPYRQSLIIHKVGLLFSNGLLFLYLVVINLINYIDDLDNIIVLLLGYMITFGCGLEMIITVVRLYYELRYGEKLEKKIQEERSIRAKQEELKRREKLKANEKRLEQEAKMRQNDAQIERNKNPYLIENQQKEDGKLEFLEWLDGRNLDQKAKDIEYFKKYTEKPLKWIQVHDKPKYSQKMKEIEEMKQKQLIKSKKRSTDPEYQEIMKSLRRQFNRMKKPTL